MRSHDLQTPARPSFALATALASCALLGAALPGQISKRQHTLYQFEGSDAGEYFGEPVERLGDVDKDGVDDFMVASPHRAVHFYSGRTGQPIHSFRRAIVGLGQNGCLRAIGDVNNDSYPDAVVGAFGGGANGEGRVFIVNGAAIALGVAPGRPEVLRALTGAHKDDQFNVVGRAGDVDNDGYDDVVIGAPRWDDTANSRADTGRVYVFSSRPGFKLIYTRTGLQAGQGLGSSVDGVGDINGDGYDDLAICSNGWDVGTSPDHGRVEIISGRFIATRQGIERLYYRDGERANDFLSGISAIEGGVDINRDGWPDLVVGAAYYDGKVQDGGRVYAISGRYMGTRGGAELLFTWTGDTAGAALGLDVNICEDIDGDSYPDVIAGAPHQPRGAHTNVGRIKVWSGRTGAELLVVDGEPGDNQFFGFRVDGAGDLNGDGFGDLITSSWGWKGTTGRAYVISGRRLTLSANEHLHSLTGTANNEQRFSLDAGSYHGGREYLMASSLGTGPFSLQGLKVPLTPGPWFNIVLPMVLGNHPVFVNWRGRLDASGKATASWTLPRIADTSLIGTTLWQAYLVHHTNPVGTFFDMASNPVPLTLVR